MTCTPNLPTNIVDFKGFDSSTILNVRGEMPRPVGDLPEGFESSNVSRDDVSREIGRTNTGADGCPPEEAGRTWIKKNKNNKEHNKTNATKINDI